MKCTIYVEGGGASNDQQRRCRQAFSTLLSKAAPHSRRRPAVVALGSRNDTFKGFCKAWAQSKPGDLILLLVDSETPVTQATKWGHLSAPPPAGDGWKSPEGATEDSIFLMVQVMETWIVADRRALEEFYGQEFKPHHLPNRSDLESVTKQALVEELDRATKSSRKGKYSRGKSTHSFELMAMVDPECLMHLPHAKQFFDFLKRALPDR